MIIFCSGPAERQGQDREKGSAADLHNGFQPENAAGVAARSAIVAGLDSFTSKIVCLIARLTPKGPQEHRRRLPTHRASRQRHQPISPA